MVFFGLACQFCRNLVEFPSADGQNAVTGARHFFEKFHNIPKVGNIVSAIDLRRQIGGRNPQSIDLTGGKNICQHQQIGAGELFCKLIKKRFGAGVGMGLEYGNDPFKSHFFHRIEQGVDLAGVMGVIVINHRPCIFPFEFEPSAHAGVRTKPISNIFGRHAVFIGGGNTSQGVEHVMLAGYQQFCFQQFLSVVAHHKGCGTLMIGNVLCHIIGLVFYTKGYHLAGQVAYTIHGACIVGIGNHQAVFFGHPQGKLAEGCFYILQILKKVQMVGFHIQNHRRGGAKMQKGIAIFAGFQHNHILFCSYPMTAPQNGQVTADHYGGVGICR